MTKQIDNETHIYNMTYDILDRLLTKTGPDGTETYTYDTKTYGLGKIATETYSNGMSKEYFYDNLSRNYKITETVENKQ
jgi:YD repeat-containing protein